MTRDSKKLRILVADDHELVRRGVKTLVRAQRGWQLVGEAVDGRDAVESLVIHGYRRTHSCAATAGINIQPAADLLHSLVHARDTDPHS